MSTRTAGEHDATKRPLQPPRNAGESLYQDGLSGIVNWRAVLADFRIACRNASPQNLLITWLAGEVFTAVVTPPPHCKPPVWVSACVSTTRKQFAGTSDRMDRAMKPFAASIVFSASLCPWLFIAMSTRCSCSLAVFGSVKPSAVRGRKVKSDSRC